MAAPKKRDVIEKVHLLLEAGMRRARDIQDALDKQGIHIGHNSINLHKRNWLASRLDAAEDGPGGDGGAHSSTTDVSGATPPQSEEGMKSFSESGDDARLEAVVGVAGTKDGKYVVTKEDLVRVCEIDLSEWVITDLQFKAYQTGMKLKRTEYDREGKRAASQEHPHVVQLFSVSAKLKRIAPKEDIDSVRDFFREFREGVAPLPPAIHVMRGRRVMAEFDLCDVHFGKLAYHRESGEDYDLKIAERVFANAVDDLIDAARGREIELIIATLGNDFTHIDNDRGETNAGTRVDTDGRFHKIKKVALWSFFNACERWRSIAPTKIKLVRGNHDWDAITGLAQGLDLRYHDVPGIEIDTEPCPQKYELYGKTLIGYQHGDEVKDSAVRDLPALMMKQAPRAWLAEAEFHEWHIGHQHRERKFTTKDTDTGVGVVMRWMHSLSATDEWHYRKSYIGARRAAEVYFYDRDFGYRGHSLALARD
jgi:hypothetical protein